MTDTRKTKLKQKLIALWYYFWAILSVIVLVDTITHNPHNDMRFNNVVWTITIINAIVFSFRIGVDDEII